MVDSARRSAGTNRKNGNRRQRTVADASVLSHNSCDGSDDGGRGLLPAGLGISVAEMQTDQRYASPHSWFSLSHSSEMKDWSWEFAVRRYLEYQITGRAGMHARC